jgi:hypothetical protein
MSQGIVQCPHCGAENAVELTRPPIRSSAPVFSGRTPRPRFGAALVKPAQTVRLYQCFNCHQLFRVAIH